MRRFDRVFIAIVIAAVLGYAMWSVLPPARTSVSVAYHNECLQKAVVEATEIEIRCKAEISEDYVPRVVTIRDTEKIRWLLFRFQLPESHEGGRGIHACAGHLAVTIRMPTDAYSLSYDHGNGMYPITKDGSPRSFIHLDPQVCAELNAYLETLGFTRAEIGY